MRHYRSYYKRYAGIFLVLMICAVHLNAQLSPGDLSEFHAHLEGLSNCTKCHTLGKQVSNQKCLDCHLELSVRIAESKGYHASVDVKGKACIECHSDHHGKNFQLIRFDTARFDHTLAGYELRGSHAKIGCSSCHRDEHIKNKKIKAKAFSYLGLDQGCLSCHQDYHQATLATDCASCHDFLTFRPASRFDHGTSRFPLRGKHAEVDCTLCHKKSVQNGKEIQQFTGLAYMNCTSCHRDIHSNKFGQNCSDCHSEVSFLQVKRMDRFDHSRTDYPLEGNHQEVACDKCHKQAYTKAMKYALCSDCHEDYHNNEFSMQDKSPDCSACHSITGFDRSTYTIDRHNKSRFPLNGAHLATPCFACHKKNEKWRFSKIGKTCADCHKNIHDLVMDKKYDPEPTCVNCHSSKRWSEIAFDHLKTGYKLEGVHLRQSCRACHFKKEKQGQSFQQFSTLSSRCTICHQDAHQNQFEVSTGTTCLECHDYKNWSASLFDHSKTEFPLDGKHKLVACVKCHPPVSTPQKTYTLYKLKSITCESCH